MTLTYLIGKQYREQNKSKGRPNYRQLIGQNDRIMGDQSTSVHVQRPSAVNLI
jgi:hypothetical protein